MLLRKRLQHILPPCTGCALCGQDIHLDRHSLAIDEQGHVTSYTVITDPCVGKRRMQILPELTVDEWNLLSQRWFAENPR
jgi:hypothetical protein